MKSYITFILILFITLSVSPAFSGQSSETLIVYYFHRTHRCPSCLLLEDLTKETVRSGFDSELKTGRIKLSIINIDDPDCAHFEKDYALEFQSVILSSVENGKETSWKNLSQVWDYLGNEEKLIKYIHNEIDLFIKKSR